MGTLCSGAGTLTRQQESGATLTSLLSKTDHQTCTGINGGTSPKKELEVHGEDQSSTATEEKETEASGL